MNTTTKFAPETRKALVKAIGEILQEKPVYQGMPGASYSCGEFVIAKDGSVTGPADLALITALAERGFDPEAPEADEPDTDCVVIEYPRADFTPEKLDNLCKMVAAKEELIKLAIGAQALPIQLEDDRVCFPWLNTTDPELVDALATFICALCKTALTKKRVTATPQPTGINDRYRFRCFMLHIGMIGSEYATARTTLLRPLSGNSGWLVPPEKAPASQAEEPAAQALEADAADAEEVQLAPEDQEVLAEEAPTDETAE